MTTGSHRLVADILQALPEAALMVDPQGRVVVANAAARALFEAPEGRRLDELLAAFECGAEPEEVFVRGAAYQVRRQALGAASGEAAGEIVRITDITAARMAARQRAQVLELLTHDMRSPQASILSLLDSLTEDVPPPGVAKRIALYARHTLALADAFVHLARAESLPLDLDLFNLPDLMVEASDVVWPQASAKGVKLVADYSEDEVLVLADRNLWARALINLVGNAVKHTPAGGRVDCRVWQEGGEAVCAITDTGQGISPDKLARLLDRFHRGAAPKPSDGVGLGLALVQTVVERHGARLDCESVEGEGARFILRMPLAPGA